MRRILKYFSLKLTKLLYSIIIAKMNGSLQPKWYISWNFISLHVGWNGSRKNFSCSCYLKSENSAKHHSKWSILACFSKILTFGVRFTAASRVERQKMWIFIIFIVSTVVLHQFYDKLCILLFIEFFLARHATDHFYCLNQLALERSLEKGMHVGSVYGGFFKTCFVKVD